MDRTRTDGGDEVCVVDDGGDIPRAAASQVQSHAGWARDGQAGGLVKLWHSLPHPAATAADSKGAARSTKGRMIKARQAASAASCTLWSSSRGNCVVAGQFAACRTLQGLTERRYGHHALHPLGDLLHGLQGRMGWDVAAVRTAWQAPAAAVPQRLCHRSPAFCLQIDTL